MISPYYHNYYFKHFKFVLEYHWLNLLFFHLVLTTNKGRNRQSNQEFRKSNKPKHEPKENFFQAPLRVTCRKRLTCMCGHLLYFSLIYFHLQAIFGILLWSGRRQEVEDNHILERRQFIQRNAHWQQNYLDEKETEFNFLLSICTEGSHHYFSELL